ncbi:DVU3141 family protein [Nitrincola sp. MINF-07-Sa-05]|uniref:DVU3141 family protein n=1 Tax=Nitrincola salilacus TaxID=3400273 RepID=UPI003917FF45
MQRKFTRALLIGSVLALVGGCSSMQNSLPFSKSHADYQAPSVTQPSLPNEIGKLLTEASISQIFQVTPSPWGDQVELRLDAPYFAATGQTCREFSVLRTSGVVSRHLACEHAAGRWLEVRLITETASTSAGN